MEWIKDYWFIIILGLVAVMFFLGYRSKDKLEGDVLEQPLTHDSEKTHKGGHGCCH